MRPRLLDGLPDDESEDTDEQRAGGWRSTCSATTAARPSPRGGRSSTGATARPSRSCATRTREALGGPEVDRRPSRSASRWQWTMRFPAAGLQARPGQRRRPARRDGATICSSSTRPRAPWSSSAVAKQGDDPPLALAPGRPVRRRRPGRRAFRVRRARRPLTGLDRRSTPASTCCCGARRGCARDATAARRARRPRPPEGAGPRSRPQRAHGPGPARDGQDLDRRAARACDLLDAGERVGVMATSHKAINNLLARDRRGGRRGRPRRSAGGEEPRSSGDDDDYASARVHCAKAPTTSPKGRCCCTRRPRGTGHAEDAARLASTCCSSTRPARSRSPTRSRSSQGAASVVLLGDPQQLAHVVAGHPPARRRRVRARAPARRRPDDPARPRRLPRHVVAHAPRRLRLRLEDDVRRRG